MSDVRIRPAQPGEEAALTELSRRSKAWWGYDPAFMALAGPAILISRETVEAGRAWTAEDGVGGLLGVVTLEPAGEFTTLELDALFVAPEAIGTGVGRALLLYALERARDLGARRVAVNSDPNAARFYEHMGGVRVGETPSEAVPGRMLPRYELSLEFESLGR